MTIEQLENRLTQLEELVLQIAKGNVNTIGKVDDTSNGLSSTDNNVEVNTANIDYIAMMSDIDIPTED